MAHTPESCPICDETLLPCDCTEECSSVGERACQIEGLNLLIDKLLVACKAAAADYYWDYNDSLGLGGEQVRIAQLLHDAIRLAEPEEEHEITRSDVL